MKGFERQPRVSNKRKMGLAGAAAVVVGSTAATAKAELILSPTAVVSNSMGQAPIGDIGNIIDQSGLSSVFISGTTDYTTWLATSPTHQTGSKGGRVWQSGFGNTTGDIVFDLGAEYRIDGLAFFQGGSSAVGGGGFRVKDISLETSFDSAFSSPLSVGTFVVPQDTGVSAWPLNEFDLADSNGRYVRLNINSNYGSTTGTQIGEIAFDVSSIAVPEPSSILLVAATGLTLFVQRLRRRLA